VGQVKAETTVNAYNRSMQIEMNCEVRFNDDDGSIVALYCGQRDLSGRLRYQAILGSSQLEISFMFSQPFTGFAFLAPATSIERPRADNVDDKLDEILEQILVLKANDAMSDIYNIEKSKFLMKPLKAFFLTQDTARQILKELFVMRTTSVKHFASYADGQAEIFELVTFYAATFDDVDHLNGILIAASKHHVDYKARHIVVRNATSPSHHLL